MPPEVTQSLSLTPRLNGDAACRDHLKRLCNADDQSLDAILRAGVSLIVVVGMVARHGPVAWDVVVDLVSVLPPCRNLCPLPSEVT